MRSSSSISSRVSWLSSTSADWNMVFCDLPASERSIAESSMISMPSRLQPCERATVSSSALVSDSVMYRQRSFSRRPWSRNCSARVVLPTPGLPSTRYRQFLGRPPHSTASSPGTPVEQTEALEVKETFGKPGIAENRLAYKRRLLKSVGASTTKMSRWNCRNGVRPFDYRQRDPTHQGDSMRFMILVKATKDSEAGVMPPESLMDE